MAQALYRKYRSKSLAEIVGQSHITDILSRAIKAGRISHAYLLTGPRGVGKTSVARILAHEINQLPYSDDSTHLDIIEIDAASNNGVEDVRDLREKVQIAPVSAAKKVYIIDEVHMLSKAAFNALLKTLEEPPEHVVFILATTDVDKLPATIISRTQRYSFRAISEPDAITHLRFIADEEKIKIDDESLAIIATRGDGSFRDSISLLDQIASLADEKTGITADLVTNTLGLAPLTVVADLLAAVETHDVTRIAQLLRDTEADGISPATLTQQLTLKLRELISEKPQFLPLFDGLLDVARSSQPSLKLLSTLGTAALENKPTKTAALATPVLEITATIEELSKQATRIKPSLKVEPISEGPLKKRSASLAVFDSTELITYTKKNYVALYSVLVKCTFELNGSDLTLYTVNTFYKKKLDDLKYSSHLYESLKALGYELTIHTIPTTKPPQDSQAAAIAVIMGGGEEVAI
ncbi:MAG: DNA polymerase III subunit gamma/tau [Candidatus Saccharimonadales bacterium]